MCQIKTLVTLDQIDQVLMPSAFETEGHNKMRPGSTGREQDESLAVSYLQKKLRVGLFCRKLRSRPSADLGASQLSLQQHSFWDMYNRGAKIQSSGFNKKIWNQLRAHELFSSFACIHTKRQITLKRIQKHGAQRTSSLREEFVSRRGKHVVWRLIQGRKGWHAT